jgi:hypothetical protein
LLYRRAMTSERLQLELARVRAGVTGCRAAGVADVGTLALLAHDAADADATAALGRAAAASGELFSGATVAPIEAGLDGARFTEVAVLSQREVHVLYKTERVVMITVCALEANLALVVAEGRAFLADIAEATYSGSQTSTS